MQQQANAKSIGKRRSSCGPPKRSIGKKKESCEPPKRSIGKSKCAQFFLFLKVGQVKAVLGCNEKMFLL